MRLPIKRICSAGFSLRFLAGLLFLCTSCTREIIEIEPSFCYFPPERYLKQLPSPFAELTEVEKQQEWSKELFLGRIFAKELDLFRAITCFKRALYLLPKEHYARRQEIEYEIFLTYYIGGKYEECVQAFEGGALFSATDQFPAIQELLILLYDAYMQTEQPEKALRILHLIEISQYETAQKLKVETALLNVDFPALEAIASNPEAEANAGSMPPLSQNTAAFLSNYKCCAKSITKAKTLNALLPGAGYYYVGQKKSAATSFLINALFITAAYQLFDRGYLAGGIIVSSLELGWYFGGINGAGIEAHDYNQVLYQTLGKEFLLQNRLFPILMIEAGF
jgi:hypothetical protein